MQPNLYPEIYALGKANESFAVCTVVGAAGSSPRHAGAKMVVRPNGSIIGTIGGGEMEHRVIKSALGCLETGKATLLEYHLNDLEKGDPGVCGGQVTIFIEPNLPAPKLIVLGAGHVGKALAKLAKWLGFWVAISDDRADLCTPDLVPDADAHIVCPMTDLPNHINLDKQSYLLLTTRGVKIDIPGLPALLESQAGFIGVIGSKKRWITTRNELVSRGISDNLISKVRSPIGINIHAETPEEIALSIMAEVLIFKNSTQGELMDINSKLGK